MTAETLFADRYRLERRLGVGGMATVQLALDTRLERHVAVKLLAEHLAEDRNFVSRFRREALSRRPPHPPQHRPGLRLRHGRALRAPVHRHGVRRRPELRGDPARAWGGSTPGDAVDILTQACRGLAYAHRNGVVHRDVKPGNLLRSRDGGQLKLADFGIAKAAEQSDITKVGSVLGTAAYLAPEQARGQPAGPPSDLYALGVVAYQLLAGPAPLRRRLAHRPRAPAGGRAARPRCTSSTRTSRAGCRSRWSGRWRASPEDRYADARRDGARPGRRAAGRPARRPPGRRRGRRPDGRDAPAGADGGDAAADPHGTGREPPATAASRSRRRRRRRGPATRREAPAPAARRSRAPRAGAPGCGACSRSCSCSPSWPRPPWPTRPSTARSDRGVQLKEQIQGDAEQTVQEIQDLIEDNVR